MLARKVKNYLAISLFLLLPQSVLANVTIPNECPSISALQSETIQEAKVNMHRHGSWIAWMDGLFSTYETWTFSMMVDAYSTKHAIEIANDRLQHLTYAEGPYSNKNGGWQCQYYIYNSSVAVANTL